MIDKGQLRSLIVRVLKDMEPEVPYSDTAVELLMLTAAVESNLGTYIEQVGGPALGIFQMEPNTEHDIWMNYIKYKPTLMQKMNGYCSEDTRVDKELSWNLCYGITMARLLYARVPAVLPENNPKALAEYWKKHYNTHLGKGTVEKAMQKYKDLVSA